MHKVRHACFGRAWQGGGIEMLEKDALQWGRVLPSATALVAEVMGFNHVRERRMSKRLAPTPAVVVSIDFRNQPPAPGAISLVVSTKLRPQ